jgi:hypothetical protein
MREVATLLHEQTHQCYSSSIGRKGKYLCVNAHWLKNYQALSKIFPNFTPPESVDEHLEDIS